jgi:hypothetical protein
MLAAIPDLESKCKDEIAALRADKSLSLECEVVPLHIKLLLSGAKTASSSPVTTFCGVRSNAATRWCEWGHDGAHMRIVGGPDVPILPAGELHHRSFGQELFLRRHNRAPSCADHPMIQDLSRPRRLLASSIKTGGRAPHSAGGPHRQ